MKSLIYRTKKGYEKYNNWDTYRKNHLMKQPMWWLLEALFLDNAPLGKTKEKLIDENIDDLWDVFLDECE